MFSRFLYHVVVTYLNDLVKPLRGKIILIALFLLQYLMSLRAMHINVRATYGICNQFIALVLSFSLLLQLFLPAISYALTSGPTQPELASFEPIGTNQMVDPFSGDFTYNLPLLVVPGPNGGYPVNLSYHAGIGMEQEASWVGLGWNINAGVINRQLRGLADDFKGDTVIKQMNIKPAATLAYAHITPYSSKELWGFDFQLNSSVQVYYNSYKGLGFSYGLGLSSIKNDLTTPGLSGSLNLNFDSQSGIGLKPSLSFINLSQSKDYAFTTGLSYNSREGVQYLNMQMGREGQLSVSKSKVIRLAGQTSTGAGVSFCKNSYLPSISMPMTGTTYSQTDKDGGEIFGDNEYKADVYSLSTQTLKTKEIYFPAYGYQYSEYRSDADNKSLMDFYRENDVNINKNIPHLPIPVSTYDIYSVSGHGISSVFRPFRSDVGIYYDPSMRSEMFEVAYGKEVAASSGSKVGLNIGAGFSESYSGKWTSNTESIEEFAFATQNGLPLYEPFYFKSSGEQTANTIQDNEAWKIESDNPIALNMTLQMGDSAFYPRISNEINNATSTLSNGKRSEREKRGQSIEKKSKEQIVNHIAYQNRAHHIYSINQFPSETVSGQQFNYETSYSKDHHITELSVLNPDGMRYKYGIPAYNAFQKDIQFSIEDTSISPYEHERFAQYDSIDATTSNSKGEDNFFNSTQLPAYAHSFLVTEIISHDYVDLTGNGPSEDDFGYYVKFNYSRNDSLYRWRIPYFDANFNKGYDSNPYDDKASYSYGEREEYYLNSIETKTHIAEFYLSDRHDGYGAHAEYNESNNKQFDSSQKLKKLDEIRLYSKNDRSTPIKVIHFEYTYELCPNVHNNDGISEIVNGENINANKGKLTLKKVWFTYSNTNKGQYSPYQFNYDAENSNENPSYDLMQMDRWGNYKPDISVAGTNADNPYVNQMNKQEQDELSGVWNLKSITLPSGGIITVEYESDDYAYVQNIPATQMSKILFTGDESGKISNVLNSQGLRIYFEPKTALENFSTSEERLAEVKKYIVGLDEIYFKAFLHLKTKINTTNLLDSAYDYVSGYAELDSANYGFEYISSLQKNIPYITLKKVTIKDNDNDDAGYTHPIRKAGWQYMKLQRPDLLYPAVAVDNLADQTINLVSSMVEDLGELLAGYYKFCNSVGYCSKIKLSAIDENATEIPSFIRLNSPDKIKFGGGHRVKKITISDEWNSMTNEKGFSYGQQYEYKMSDGSSSGVAEYEPLIGGDENAMHKPIRYSTERFLSKIEDNALFLEEPLGESFYPSPNVGYRRLLVKALDHEGVTQSASGITEYKFYTAKEFPLKVKASSEVDKDAKSEFGLFIPFIGTAMFTIHGYSEGYAITLNDMHGKLRSTSTYAAYASLYGNNEDLSQAVSETMYEYLCSSDFDESKNNYLNNTVTVLDADGVYRQAELGVSRDLYLDEREQSSYSVSAGLNANLEYQPTGVLVSSAFPSFELNIGMFRSIVSTKLISQTAILSGVRETSEGSTVTSRNLMFDAETGSPLLTSVTNEFENPIYRYTYAAHWYNNGMKPAYRNIGAKFDVTTNYSGIYSINDAATYFNQGDELTETSGSNRQTYWVQEVSTNSIKIVKEDGSNATNLNSTLQITKSAYRNLQALKSGTIISLTDPVNGSNIQNVLDAFNATIGTNAPTITSLITDDNASTYSAYTLSFKFYDCYSGDSLPISFINHMAYDDLPDSTNFYFAFNNSDGLNDNCISMITFPKKINDPQDYYLKLVNNEIIAENRNTGEVLLCIWDNPSQCFSRCTEDILDASSVTFKDNWDYNYTDLANPEFKDANGAVISSASTSAYRFGKKGIWRAEKNYVCLTERSQSSPTAISRDGTYQLFSPFDWDTSASNPTWTMSNEITQYSPYGYETENKNAIGIYATALYGYNNSLVTALASNASYAELAFDGFEDYSSTTVIPGHGHFKFYKQNGSSANLSTNYAHTGEYSLLVSSLDTKLADTLKTGTSSNVSYVQLKPNTEYLISAWVYLPDYTKANLKVRRGATILAEQTLDSLSNSIDGWRKIDVQFISPSSNADVILELKAIPLKQLLGATVYFDDIRLRPFNSSIKTFVYNPSKLWLMAELDDQNYSTFYNYDEEGSLTQTKKETERGIVTIQSTRSNTRKTTSP